MENTLEEFLGRIPRRRDWVLLTTKNLWDNDSEHSVVSYMSNGA